MDSARLVHHIEGRTRFRIPGRTGDVAWFESAVKALGTLDGVKSISARPETGSILLVHAISPMAIASFAHERDLFALEPDDEGPALPTELMATLAPLTTLARWEVLAIAGLVGMAAYQALRGEVFGPAVSHAIQAAEIIRRKWGG